MESLIRRGSPPAAALRTKLLALARRYGRTPALVHAARQAIAEHTPALATALGDAQVMAFLDAARGIVRRAEIPPGKRPPTLPPYGGGNDPGVRLPAIEKAAEYLRTRIGFPPAEFDTLDADAKRVGFTVAGAAGDDAVEAVRRALADDVNSGGTLREFRAKVEDSLAGSAVSPKQVEAIYRTYVGRAYSAGQIAVLEHPLVRDEFPYLLYSATHDIRVRKEHLMMETLGLDGTAVYRADDPVWDLFYPPWAWNCRCVVIPLSVEDAAERGVREAQRWLRSGRPPDVPEFVPPLPFAPPPGWVPTGRRLAAA